MTTVNELTVDALKERVVAIVSFRNIQNEDMEKNGLSRPGLYFQVTIDPDMKSPSGEFIRLGYALGDEILGWQRVSSIKIEEVLQRGDTVPAIQAAQPSGLGGVTLPAEAVAR